jgi:hypothetical protein
MKLVSISIKLLSALVGIGFFLIGLTWIFIAVSGEIRPSPTFGYVAGTTFVVVSTPFLAYLFSLRLAKVLGVIALSIFAVAILWLAFQPSLPDKHPAIAQAAAIAFAVLWFARVGLALRRKPRPKLGT